MIFLESDSDDEIEIVSVFAMEEEWLKRERALTLRCGSILGRKVIKRDFCKAKKDCFVIILQNLQFFLLIYSEGGFKWVVHPFFFFSSSICTRSAWSIFHPKKKCCRNAWFVFPSEDNCSTKDARLWSSSWFYWRVCEN